MRRAQQQLHLKWDDFQNNVTLTFQELQQRADFSDVTLVSGDGQKIEAHKLILTCGSNFFRAVLAENQNPHPLIYMRGIEGKVLANVVAFIYHGQVRTPEIDPLQIAPQVNLPENELNDFIQFATELQLKGVEVTEEHRSQFQDSRITLHTLQQRETSSMNKSIKTEKTKKVHTQEILSERSSFEGNPDVSGLRIDENTTVVKFKEKNPTLEEKIQTLVVRSDQGWGCNVCDKVNVKKGKIKKHVETHIDGFAHLCPYCEKMCKTSNGLEVHVKNKHEESFVSKTEHNL